jgi:hypothetical protein
MEKHHEERLAGLTVELGPAVREELAQAAIEPAAGELLQHVAEVGPGLQAVEDGGLQHGEEDGGAVIRRDRASGLAMEARPIKDGRANRSSRFKVKALARWTGGPAWSR